MKLKKIKRNQRVIRIIFKMSCVCILGSIIHFSYSIPLKSQQPQRPRLFQNFLDTSSSPTPQTMEIHRIYKGQIESSNVRLDTVVLGRDEDFIVISKGESIYHYSPSKLVQLEPKWENSFAIPELYWARESGTNNILQFQILTMIQRTMKYDKERDTFDGTIAIILLDNSRNLSEGNNLNVPVSCEIFAQIDSVQPNKVTIDHINIPSTTINLFDQDPKDSIKFSIRTTLNQKGYEEYIDVDPELIMISNRNSIQGYGVQSAQVSVFAKGITYSDSIQVILQPTLGSFKRDKIFISSDKGEVIYLRSEGLGSAKVIAQSAIIGSAEVQIQYIFPWIFLIASLLGGLIGSLIKLLRHGDKRKNTYYFFGGILSGIVVAAAYFILGIDVLKLQIDIQYFNEAAVFTLSALGAIIGIREGKK